MRVSDCRVGACIPSFGLSGRQSSKSDNNSESHEFSQGLLSSASEPKQPDASTAHESM